MRSCARACVRACACVCVREREYISDSLKMGIGRGGVPENIIRNSYTMGCPPVRGDNPRALASGLSYVQVDKQGITILYHLH